MSLVYNPHVQLAMSHMMWQAASLDIKCRAERVRACAFPVSRTHARSRSARTHAHVHVLPRSTLQLAIYIGFM